MTDKDVKKMEELIEKLQRENATLAEDNTELMKANTKALDEIAALSARLQAANQTLAEKTAECQKLEEAFFEKRAGANARVEPVMQEPEISEADMKLIEEACMAHGIDSEYVNKARIEDGSAVVMTVGGARIRYRPGDVRAEGFKRLSQIQVTGVNPEARKRKPIVGRGAKA